MTEHTPDVDIIILQAGKPVALGGRAEQMVRAIVDVREQIEAQKSGLLELHYGPSDVQAFLRLKLKWFKV